MQEVKSRNGRILAVVTEGDQQAGEGNSGYCTGDSKNPECAGSAAERGSAAAACLLCGCG